MTNTYDITSWSTTASCTATRFSTVRAQLVPCVQRVHITRFASRSFVQVVCQMLCSAHKAGWCLTGTNAFMRAAHQPACHHASVCSHHRRWLIRGVRMRAAQPTATWRGATRGPRRDKLRWSLVARIACCTGAGAARHMTCLPDCVPIEVHKLGLVYISVSSHHSRVRSHALTLSLTNLHTLYISRASSALSLSI